MTIDSKLELLTRWRRNSQRSQIANYDAANRFSKRNYWLGVPTVILSAVVGTSVFVALGQTVDPWIQISVGLVSVVSSVLAALQTFLRWGEQASKCRATASEYGSVKRQLDQLIAKLNQNEEVPDETVSTIREQMDTLSREAPELPKDIWVGARKEVRTELERKNA